MPPTTKRIVCLANSRKLSGRCIAGKEVSASGSAVGWVRPVSARQHQEVSERDRQYEDGSDPRVLDLIDVPLLGHTPNGYQQENWTLDPQYYWRRAGRVSWTDIFNFVDPVSQLWLNDQSTYNGRNDEIGLSNAASLTSSLCIFHVPGLHLHVFKPGEAFGDPKRRVQARFAHAGVDYYLWVTDPVYERRYLALPDGQYALGDSFLTISLGEPYKGNCHKLVAAIIERQ